MKNLLRIVNSIILSILCLHAMAGAPQGINYQSVVRDSSGRIVSNHAVSVRFSIHDSTLAGAIIYKETHNISTNAFGIFSTVIGTGQGLVGTFPGIDWSTAAKFLQVEMDLTGTGSYSDMGTSQFLSVPYSIYSNAAAISSSAIASTRFDTAGVLSISTIQPATYTTATGAWLTKGNATLSNATNFIGTTDNTDLILKGHNVESIRITTGGALLATGNAAGITPSSGAGTKFMWIPAKGALRAGTVSGTMWDNANIGANSIALGKDVQASGAASVAIGSNNAVMADKATAFGNGLIAKTMGATVVGSFNDTTGSGSGTVWNPNDPLFQIGNGSSGSTRTTALTITKAGDISAAGLMVTQGFSITPGTMSMSGNATLTVGNKSMYFITSTVPAPSANITLSNGVKAGQVLYIEVKGTGAHGVRFNDNTSYNLSLSGNLDLQNTDTVTLMWDGSTWIGINNSINH